jgi:hypothetical protein
MPRLEGTERAGHVPGRRRGAWIERMLRLKDDFKVEIFASPPHALVTPCRDVAWMDDL